MSKSTVKLSQSGALCVAAPAEDARDSRSDYGNRITIFKPVIQNV